MANNIMVNLSYTRRDKQCGHLSFSAEDFFDEPDEEGVYEIDDCWRYLEPDMYIGIPTDLLSEIRIDINDCSLKKRETYLYKWWGKNRLTLSQTFQNDALLCNELIISIMEKTSEIMHVIKIDNIGDNLELIMHNCIDLVTDEVMDFMEN